MRDKRLARLFVRYRERGDVDALTAVFDATAPGLHGLARHLVRAHGEGSDGGDAEDVLQATFLAAIEHAGGYDAGQPLEPWLTGILVRKARQANERASRRPQPERVSTPTVLDPEQHASLAELDEALRAALAALPERYRRVLQPFLQGDEKPQEIARRHSIAPGTVRVQIHRGLELLRRALPTGYALGGLASVLSSPQWSRLRAEVARAARAHAAQGAASAGAATGATGALSIGATTPIAPIAALTTLAVLAGAGAWWLTGDAAPPPRSTAVAVSDGATSAPVERAPQGASAAERADSGAETSAVRKPDPASAPEDVSRWVLVANVRGLDPAPPGGLAMRVSWGKGGRDDGVSQLVELHQDGPLEVELEHFAASRNARDARVHLTVREGEYAALDRHSEHWSVDGEGRGVFVADVDLERARSRISGRIEPADGLDLTGAHVAFYPEDDDGRPSDERSTTARCEEDGSFSFTIEPERGFVAGIVPERSPWGRALDLRRPRHVDLGVIRPARAASISGIAYFEGRPLEAPGQVLVRHAATWREGTRVVLERTPIGIVDGDAVVADATVDTDEAGVFEIDGLSAGEYDVFFVPRLPVTGSFNVSEDGLRVRAPVGGLELDSPVRIYTVLVSCDGVPVADAAVMRVLSKEESVTTLTGVDGTVQFYTVVSGAQRIAIEKAGFQTRYVLAGLADFGPQRLLQVELERTAEPANLRLELNVAHGVRAAPVHVGLERMAGANAVGALYRRELTPTDGVLEFGEVPPGSYRVWVAPGLPATLEPRDMDFWLPTTVHVDCRAGEITRKVLEPRTGGRLAVHVRGLSGAGDPGLEWHLGRDTSGGSHLTFLVQDAESGRVHSIAADEIRDDGTYWLAGPLEPERYTLSLRVRGDAGIGPIERTFDVRAGRVTDVHVD